jgi:hypothetical protein
MLHAPCLSSARECPEHTPVDAFLIQYAQYMAMQYKRKASKGTDTRPRLPTLPCLALLCAYHRVRAQKHSSSSHSSLTVVTDTAAVRVASRLGRGPRAWGSFQLRPPTAIVV